MKTITIITVLILTLLLTSCSWSKPLTEAEQAAEKWMTLQEYRETKDAAARMNMWVDTHMKMTDKDNMWDWNMMNDNIMKQPIIEEDDMMMNN